MIQALASRYALVLADQSDTALSDAGERLAFVGEAVTIEDGNTVHAGILRGLSATGALLLESRSELLTIHAGDLTRGPRPT
jgi:biotin-(acetyl-CoA carboxylase) ligase